MLAYFSLGGPYLKDIFVTGANLHVVNGTGATDQPEAYYTGNLIIGYDEQPQPAVEKQGFHNLILGKFNSYTGYAGIVAGEYSTVQGGFAAVLGGLYNKATSLGAVVVGGYNNLATNAYATVGGGAYNQASGSGAAIAGGYAGQATGAEAAIGGGYFVSVGDPNPTPVWSAGKLTTVETDVIVSGGNLRVVNGMGTTDTVNGLGNVIVGYNETAGGGFDDRSGSHMVVVGTKNNYASYGGIVSGQYNAVHAPFAVVLAGATHDVTGIGGAVVGGYGSVAGGGGYASVFGGVQGTANGNFSTVVGGQFNTAGDPSNSAIGYASTVTGGYFNTSKGSHSTVGGGLQVMTTNFYQWAAGNLTYTP